MGVGVQADPLTCVPSQILSFPSSPGSQASARPCAHLRLTQTLRRVPKVTHPTLGLTALGCFPRCIDTTPSTPASLGASPLPPATLCSTQSPPPVWGPLNMSGPVCAAVLAWLPFPGSSWPPPLAMGRKWHVLGGFY